MTRARGQPEHTAEAWGTPETAHKTVAKAPALVAANREMVDAVRDVISRYQRDIRDRNGSLTVRQIFYQLIEWIGLVNNESSYKKVGEVLVAARLQGLIPWAHIVDRSRTMLTVSMWSDIGAFAHTAGYSYRGDVWATQEQKVGVWVEKDARAAWVAQIVRPYGVTVIPGRGSSSWGLIREVVEVLGDGYGASVLYLGDFDPSGLVIGEHVRMGLGALGCRPEWRLLAVRHEDMLDIPRAAWQAPKDEHYDEKLGRTVKGDPNTRKFLEKYGAEQKTAEVDSMPPALLRARILDAVHERMDMPAWRRRMRLDSVEKQAVRKALDALDDPDVQREMEIEAPRYTMAYFNREDEAEASAQHIADYADVEGDLDDNDNDDVVGGDTTSDDDDALMAVVNNHYRAYTAALYVWSAAEEAREDAAVIARALERAIALSDTLVAAARPLYPDLDAALAEAAVEAAANGGSDAEAAAALRGRVSELEHRLINAVGEWAEVDGEWAENNE